MNSIKQFSANRSLTVMVAVLIAIASFGISTSVVFASEDSFVDVGGGDYNFYDTYTPDTNYYDTYTPDYTYNDTYTPDYTYNDTYTPDYTFNDTYTPDYTFNDTYTPEYTFNDTYTPEYSFNDTYTPEYTYNDTYTPEYVNSYLDQYGQSYASNSYGSTGSYGGGSSGGSSGGYSMPSFGSTGGCTSCHYQTPSYPTPTCTTCNRPTPPPPQVCPSGTTGTYPNCHTTQYCPSGTTGTYPNCHTIPTPTCTTCNGGSTSNWYYNTNTNTWIDNSINGSYNTNYTNSGNTNITTVAPVVPQQIVQYQYQNQYQAPAPYCVITLQNAGAYNTQARLVWSSSNATNAYITSVGTVAANGSQYVTGYANQIYSLTVSGQGGSYTCQTQAFVPTYTPTIQNPSVSLSQIPYTGLALGPVAQAFYWLSLFSVAAAGAYLLVYFKGGALALATGSFTNRRENHIVVSEEEATEIEAPASVETEEETVTTPIANNILNFLPAMAEMKTRDAMSMVRAADGMPRIVISRA